MLIPPNAVIVDTNVMSYAIRRAPIARDYERLLIGRTICVSFITVGELLFWTKKYRWGPTRCMQLKQFLSHFPTVPFSNGMEDRYAEVMADRQRLGRMIDRADAWIAATALYHKVPLVTHDEDFADTPGLRIITASPSVSELRATWRGFLYLSSREPQDQIRSSEFPASTEGC
jgi:predicted nucleic acid-binding protein